jgi:hypothetical protein
MLRVKPNNDFQSTKKIVLAINFAQKQGSTPLCSHKYPNTGSANCAMDACVVLVDKLKWSN